MPMKMNFCLNKVVECNPSWSIRQKLCEKGFENWNRSSNSRAFAFVPNSNIWIRTLLYWSYKLQTFFCMPNTPLILYVRLLVLCHLAAVYIRILMVSALFDISQPSLIGNYRSRKCNKFSMTSMKRWETSIQFKQFNWKLVVVN